MKVAILLSGQLREVELGYSYIYKNLMEGYDCDVFIHSWYDKGDQGKKFSKWWGSTFDSKSKDLVLDLYKPKSYIFENQKVFDRKNYDASQFEGDYRVDATLSMFYSIKKCNDIKNVYSSENNIKYDVVVRVRFDFAIFNKIIYEDHDFINNIFFKDDCNHEKGVCMNDHFAFGSEENMNIYCNTFDVIDELYNEYNTPFNPETFLGRNLRVLNNIRCLNTSIKSGIIRNNGNNFYVSNT